MEHRMKCNVCGKIWCFTDEDVNESKMHSVNSAISAVGTIASAFAGTKLDMYALDNKGDREAAKVVDYFKCPDCGSNKTKEITENEIRENNGKDERTVSSYQINANATIDSIIKRINIFIEEQNWDKAEAYIEQALDIDPENGFLYYLQLLATNRSTDGEELASIPQIIENGSFKLARRYGDPSILAKLDKIELLAEENNRKREEEKRQKEEEAYRQLRDRSIEKSEKTILEEGTSAKDIREALEELGKWKDYDKYTEYEKKANERIKEIELSAVKRKKIFIVVAIICGIVLVLGILYYAVITPQIHKKNKYEEAIAYIQQEDYESAYWILQGIGDYKDSEKLLAEVKEYRAEIVLRQKEREDNEYTVEHINEFFVEGRTYELTQRINAFSEEFLSENSEALLIKNLYETFNMDYCGVWYYYEHNTKQMDDYITIIPIYKNEIMGYAIYNDFEEITMESLDSRAIHVYENGVVTYTKNGETWTYLLSPDGSRLTSRYSSSSYNIEYEYGK